MKERIKSLWEKNTTRLLVDLFTLQLRWTVWYLAILFILIGALRFLVGFADERGNVMWLVFQPSTIYMFVIATITGYVFLSFYMRVGLTRRAFFKAMSISALMLVAFVVLFSVLGQAILELVAGMSAYEAPKTHADFLATDSFYVLPALSYFAILLSYYVAGWLVVTGFYRYRGYRPALFILAGLAFLILSSLFWRGESFQLFLWIGARLPEAPLGVAIAGTLFLSLLGVVAIHHFLKDTPIRLK